MAEQLQKSNPDLTVPLEILCDEAISHNWQEHVRDQKLRQEAANLLKSSP
jgi:hypothetical protein